MDEPQDNRVEQVLNSLSGMQRAEADPALYEGILSRIGRGAGKVRELVPLRVVLASAASFALLAVLNWQLLHPRPPQHRLLQGEGTEAGAGQLMQGYGLDRNPFILYAD